MNNILKAIISIPKSIWVNYRYLPIKQAIKRPLLVSYNSTFSSHRGRVILVGNHGFASVRIGFHEVTVAPNDRTICRIFGSIRFQGRAYIGQSTKIYVQKNATLELGDDFKISAATSIFCCRSIVFGKNIQFSWDCLVMDSDTHSIIYEDGQLSQPTKPVLFGDNIWIGCRCTILKGSNIPSNCVIGANTTITGQQFEGHSIIAGNPPRVVKIIRGWLL